MRIQQRFDDEGEEYAVELYDVDVFANEDEMRRGDLELYDPETGINNLENALEKARDDSFFDELLTNDTQDGDEEEGPTVI